MGALLRDHGHRSMWAGVDHKMDGLVPGNGGQADSTRAVPRILPVPPPPHQESHEPQQWGLAHHRTPISLSLKRLHILNLKGKQREPPSAGFLPK